MKPHSSRGFTLIEVVVALVLFGLGFSLILENAGQAMRNTRLSKEYTQATLWAQSKLDELAVLQELEPGVASGEFDEQFTWELSISPYELADVAPESLPQSLELLHVQLTVYWRSGQHERQAGFSTLRLVSGDRR